MRPLFAGNWKMNGLARQLGEIEAIAISVEASPPLADILICPPTTLIERTARTAAGRIAIEERTATPKSPARSREMSARRC